MLEKMTITSEHPLSKQVFWLDYNKCLRPMLAPNLYYLLRDQLPDEKVAVVAGSRAIKRTLLVEPLAMGI